MDMKDALTGIQTRLGRALIGWSVADLAECAKVATSTIKRIERIDGVKENSEFSTLIKVRNCLNSHVEEKGWHFTESGGIAPLPSEKL